MTDLKSISIEEFIDGIPHESDSKQRSHLSNLAVILELRTASDLFNKTEKEVMMAGFDPNWDRTKRAPSLYGRKTRDTIKRRFAALGYRWGGQ